jgi:hypothetical protein
VGGGLIYCESTGKIDSASLPLPRLNLYAYLHMSFPSHSCEYILGDWIHNSLSGCPSSSTNNGLARSKLYVRKLYALASYFYYPCLRTPPPPSLPAPSSDLSCCRSSSKSFFIRTSLIVFHHTTQGSTH